MDEIQCTIKKLEDQKIKALTLQRAISEHEKLTTSQNVLNLPPKAFFTANAVVDPATGASLEYPQLKLGNEAKAWIKGCSNEIGRLARGVYPHDDRVQYDPFHLSTPKTN